MMFVQCVLIYCFLGIVAPAAVFDIGFVLVSVAPCIFGVGGGVVVFHYLREMIALFVSVGVSVVCVLLLLMLLSVAGRVPSWLNLGVRWVGARASGRAFRFLCFES